MNLKILFTGLVSISLSYAAELSDQPNNHQHQTSNQDANHAKNNEIRAIVRKHFPFMNNNNNIDIKSAKEAAFQRFINNFPTKDMIFIIKKLYPQLDLDGLYQYNKDLFKTPDAFMYALKFKRKAENSTRYLIGLLILLKECGYELNIREIIFLSFPANSKHKLPQGKDFATCATEAYLSLKTNPLVNAINMACLGASIPPILTYCQSLSELEKSIRIANLSK